MAGSHQFHREVVEIAVRQCFPWMAGTAAAIIDCRSVHDPRGRELRMHTGLHPALFDNIIGNPHFPAILQRMKDFLSEHMAAGGERPVTLCFVCNKGRHRSVACARVASEIAVRYDYFQLGIIGHGGGLTSPGTCGGCDRCMWWTRQWAVRNRALERALDIWQGSAGARC